MVAVNTGTSRIDPRLQKFRPELRKCIWLFPAISREYHQVWLDSIRTSGDFVSQNITLKANVLNIDNISGTVVGTSHELCHLTLLPPVIRKLREKRELDHLPSDPFNHPQMQQRRKPRPPRVFPLSCPGCSWLHLN